MSNSQKNPNNQTINCTNASKNDDVCKQIDNDAVKQFKILVSIVFIGLIIFLIYFIYNLIKCYLPKWRRERQLREEVERKVEIKNSSPEKPEIELA
jgi:hypothetical protein